MLPGVRGSGLFRPRDGSDEDGDAAEPDRLPRLGRKRNAQEAHTMAPGWYRWAARAVLAMGCAVPVVFVSVMMALRWHPSP